MRSKLLNSIVIIIFIFTLFTFSPSQINGASENTIRALNIVGQGIGTLLKGIIQGKVKNLKSAGKMLFWGSVAGYGFFEAKRIIGKGHITEGVILANISASITENTARGDNPFSYIGYSIGPARIQVATPLAGKNRTLFNIKVSPMDLYGFVISLNRADRIKFRNGMITFEANEPFVGNVRGWTLGMYPTIVVDKPEHVFSHETIHVAQYIQTMSISPQPFTKLLSNEEGSRRTFRASLLNFNYLEVFNGLTFNGNEPNHEIWNEVEAYALAKEKTTE